MLYFNDERFRHVLTVPAIFVKTSALCPQYWRPAVARLAPTHPDLATLVRHAWQWRQGGAKTWMQLRPELTVTSAGTLDDHDRFGGELPPGRNR